MARITVRLKERSYNIIIDKDLNNLSRQLKNIRLGTDAVVITNPRIRSLFQQKFKNSLKGSTLRLKFVLVPDSEKAKSLGQANRLLKSISEIDGKGRRVCVIALGGGVVGDLAGFVASIYKRGIPYIQIPTTLLAQVDSSIGGKVAVDLPEGKNLVGAFCQPRLVYTDISFLKDLSERDFISGMAEVIKYGIIKDKALFEYLRRNRNAILKRHAETLFKIVRSCAKIKADIVSADERERKSLRTVLNLGHTVGHAIESACAYSKNYSHGEAIAIGMIAAARISNTLGYLSRDALAEIEETIEMFGLPACIKRVTTEKILKSLVYDKKFIHGVTRFVLPVSIGKVIIKEGIAESVIRGELERLTG